MKKSVRGASAVLLLSCSFGLAAEERDEANASCRQETKRVVVWPHGPKATAMTRSENREVTVCDAKASQASGRQSNQS
jgi:hypothetical protein